MILKQGHKYEPMPHDGKLIAYIYRGGRCYYKDSPYSLEATQALKAAFPAYWTAIRDYGYAHPQLVPFINEDPMLIVSLVEVGKTRWLVGDNVAKISTDILATQSTKVEIEFILTSYSNTNATIIVAGSTWNNPQTTYGVFFNYSIKKFFNAGTGTGFGGIIELNALYNVKLNAMNNYCTINDGRVNGKTAFVGSVTDRGFVTKFHGKISFVDIDDHRLIPHLCPNGEAGMLDIVSLTFYPNANTQGTFTIAITDKE